MKVLARRTKIRSAPEASLHTPPGESFVVEPTHLPKVDLLPSTVQSKVAIARIRRWATSAFVLLLAAASGLWWMQASSIESAQQSLIQAQSINSELNDAVQRLSPIAELTSQLEDQSELINTALAANPAAESILSELEASGSNVGVSFSTASVTVLGLTDPSGQSLACPKPDPFSDVLLVGCISFSGFAPDRDAVARLLDALQAEPMFEGPFLSSSTTTASTDGGSLVALAGTVGLTPDALMTPPSPEEIAEFLNPPEEPSIQDDQEAPQ